MYSLLLISLATLASEDLACITTGALVAQGKLGFWPGTLACLFGIVFGDLLVYFAGRVLGRAAFRWGALARWLPPERVETASEWLRAKGFRVVFASRFVPGLRLPTYFAAGLLRTRLPRFALYFFAAAAVWTPALVALTAAGGERLTSGLSSATGSAGLALAALVLAFALLIRAARALFRFRTRRRVVGFFKRKFHWEFWPIWAVYLPLAPYLLWLAFRHRSLTLFTAANPGIPSGGFVGESKSVILDHLSRVEDAVAAYDVIPASLRPDARVQRAYEFLRRRDLAFPIVLKPDVGERGAGVSIARNATEFEAYLRAAAGDTIVQEYVPGVEFGVFYVRLPEEPAGRIVSITEKRLPEVPGDGHSSFEELVLRDSRAVCLARAYLAGARRRPDEVPSAGERVPLVELGSHCRGAIFMDGRRWNTAALEAAIDRISRSHPGFYMGRYDIRSASLEALRAGERFKVIELNGVSAEATHIYDPAVSLFEAYAAMIRHWRTAFRIGAWNRARGFPPMTLLSLLRAILNRRATGTYNSFHADRQPAAVRAGLPEAASLR